MHISALRIKNYKSFHDSGEIHFDRGLNILIGANSSGKTALLETLGLRISPNPHLSRKSKPTRNSKIVEDPTITVSINIQPDEFREICRTFDSPLIFPRFDDHDLALGQLNAFLVNGLTIRGQISQSGFLSRSLDYGLNAHKEGFNRVSYDEGFAFMSQEGNSDQEFGLQVLREFRNKVYRFHAERPNVGRCPIGLATELRPDAANLAEVLHVLHTKNPPRFTLLNRLLTKIFPFMTGVSVTMEDNSESHAKVFEIQVWLDKDREDLVIPLNQCGTGIGQALAILYILVNSTEGRTIIIDEPQSFLHPGAARTLVQIMSEHKEHQYFISTHAPEILASTKSSTVTALEYEDGESSVKALTVTQSDELRKVFTDLGIDFSIFFATRVLWVEGATEEKAFPLIVEKFLGGEFAAEITIHALADTGSLAKKNTKRMFDIYRALSGSHALVPPIAAVILDNENRAAQETAELQRLGGGLLHFINRTCYENYLLDSEAIAAIASQQENFAETPITGEQVESVIRAAKAERRFLPEQHANAASELKEEEWVQIVDGARLLQFVFSELSQCRVAYQKTVHSVEMTKWMLANDRGDLREIADLIRAVTP